jgi:tetratricopeptide (TPR) repeat protein
MADNQRIEDLRRRVHKDPASIAFAQLAEELRRNGDYTESVEVCRTGLAIHPGYLSARVTLGRALLELNQLEDAQAELQLVLKSAPENLAALRALAETHQRLGSDTDALNSYRSALLLAKNDPDLQQTVDELSRKVEPQVIAVSTAPLTSDQTASDLALHPPPTPASAFSYFTQAAEDLPLHTPAEPTAEPLPEIVPEIVEPAIEMPAAAAPVAPVADIWASLTAPAPAAPAPMAEMSAEDTAAREKAVRTIAALEQWLEAIHVARAQRRA